MDKPAGTPRHQDPSLEEIAARCREIQAGWSAATLRRRLAFPLAKPVEIAQIREIDVICAISERILGG